MWGLGLYWGQGFFAGSWKLEAGSWKLEAGSWKLEAGSWKLEAGKVLGMVALASIVCAHTPRHTREGGYPGGFWLDTEFEWA